MKEHWYLWAPAVLPVAAAAWACYMFFGPSSEPTESFPQRLCTYQATGRYRTWTSTTCYPANNNPCGIQLPETHTEREVDVTCSGAVWR